MGLKKKIIPLIPGPLKNRLSSISRDAGYLFNYVKTIRRDPPFDPQVEFESTEGLHGLAPFLVGTQSGLLMFKNGRFSRFQGGSVYGITLDHEETCYFFQRIPKSFGRVVKYSLNNGLLQPLINFLSTGIHQIDLIGDVLAVSDTYNNNIALYNVRGKLLKKIYLNGKLRNGRKSPNYSHFNSIFRSKENIFILAHNESAKTGRYSEIYKLNLNWQPIDIISTTSRSAHNVALIEGALWHCDSMRGRLDCCGRTVYRDSGCYTRGLAVNECNILLGGSMFAEKAERWSTDGVVIVLNRSYHELARIHIKGCGGIYEIRFLKDDLGMSNKHPLGSRTDNIESIRAA